MMMDVDDACQRWVLSPLSGWLLFVLFSFINLLLMLAVCRIHYPCAAVVHGKIPLESVSNDAVCKPSYLHYPQWLIVVCDTYCCYCFFVTCCCCCSWCVVLVYCWWWTSRWWLLLFQIPRILSQIVANYNFWYVSFLALLTNFQVQYQAGLHTRKHSCWILVRFWQWMMSNDDVGGEFRMVAVDLVACILLLSAAAGWLLYLILVVVVIVIFIVSVLLSDSCLLLGVHRPRVVDGWEGWYYHSPLTDDSSIVGMVYSPTAYCCVYCCYKDNITWTAQQMVWSEWRQEWTWLIVVCGINWIVRRMFVHDVQQRT